MQIQEIDALIRSYRDNIEDHKKLVYEDREKNTVKRNGVQIKSEEVITDFLNHKSENLKKFMM